MSDPVYEDAVQQLKEFNGKKLKSTTKEGLDIEDDDEKKKLEELKATFQSLTKLMKEVLPISCKVVGAPFGVTHPPADTKPCCWSMVHHSRPPLQPM